MIVDQAGHEGFVGAVDDFGVAAFVGGDGVRGDFGDGVASDEDVHRGGEGIIFAVEDADVGEEGGRGWGCLG